MIGVAAPEAAAGAQERKEDDGIPQEVAGRLRPSVDVYEFIARH